MTITTIMIITIIAYSYSYSYFIFYILCLFLHLSLFEFLLDGRATEGQESLQGWEYPNFQGTLNFPNLYCDETHWLSQSFLGLPHIDPAIEKLMLQYSILGNEVQLRWLREEVAKRPIRVPYSLEPRQDCVRVQRVVLALVGRVCRSSATADFYKSVAATLLGMLGQRSCFTYLLGDPVHCIISFVCGTEPMRVPHSRFIQYADEPVLAYDEAHFLRSSFDATYTAPPFKEFWRLRCVLGALIANEDYLLDEAVSTRRCCTRRRQVCNSVMDKWGLVHMKDFTI
jgi:hypothetical protein